MMNVETQTIRKEFRRSKEARYIHRLHGVLLVERGLSTVKAGKLLGTPQRTVAGWVKTFKQGGLIALEDEEKTGRPSQLSPKARRGLEAALIRSPADFGLEGEVWTGERVSSFLERRFGLTLTMRQGRRILRAFEREQPNT